MTTPYDRLMAEAIPTRPPPVPFSKPVTEPWTPEEQARHWADLGEALDGWTYGRDRRRHLRLVDTEADDRAA